MCVCKWLRFNFAHVYIVSKVKDASQLHRLCLFREYTALGSILFHFNSRACDFIPLGYVPRSALAGLEGRPICNLFRDCKAIYIFSSSIRKFWFFTLSPRLVVVSLFNFSHFAWWYFPVVYFFISLLTSNI